MAIKTQTIMPIGMNKDSIIGTGNSSKYVYENMNLRYITIEDSTTGSWVTEKGTLFKGEIEGFTPIGQAIINDYWVLFGKKENTDYIYKLYYNPELTIDLLYEGNLNFNLNNKIETTTYYENEDIQKVYWVDGINQLRVINIVNVKASSNLDTQFDVLPTLSLNEEVSINKVYNGAGMFSSGTIQYFITYYNKYGQESNIIYSSPLYYNTLENRGINPDGSEFSSNSYTITLTHIDTEHKFDFLRIYSLCRPAKNAPPIAKIVVDANVSSIDANDTFCFTDTNTTGEVIDPTILLFLGGRKVIPSTLEQKNNTLFLGNLNLDVTSIPTNIKNKLKEGTLSFIYEDLKEELHSPSFTNNKYPYNFELKYNSAEITTFKYNDTYRFGIQLIDNHGIWSEVIYLGDITNYNKPIDNKRTVVKYTLTSTENIFNGTTYKKARLVCCYPSLMDMDVIAQGVVCPTMYHPKWEKDHAPDRFASWFFRPMSGKEPLSKPSIVDGVVGHKVELNDKVSLLLSINHSSENWVAFTNANDQNLIVNTGRKLLDFELTNLDLNNNYKCIYSKINDTNNGFGLKLTVQSTYSLDAISRDWVNVFDIVIYKNDKFSYYIYSYKYNQQRPSVTLNNISNNNNTEAAVLEFPDSNSYKVIYSNDSQFLEVSQDDSDVSDLNTNLKKVSYQVLLAWTRESVETGLVLTLKLLDFHPTISPVSLGTIINKPAEESFLYYSGDVDGGWSWDAKGRVVNEVQSADVISTDYKKDEIKDEWGFYVDINKWFTFHSPDIEFNEAVHTMNLQDLRIRIVGQVNQTSWNTEHFILSTPAVDVLGNEGTGVIDTNTPHSWIAGFGSIKDVNTKYCYWRDLDVYAANNLRSSEANSTQIDYLQYSYLVYPFQRKYLNNYARSLEIVDSCKGKDLTHKVLASGEIKLKTLATSRVFGNTMYYDTTTSSVDSCNAKLFNSTNILPIKIKSTVYSGYVNDIAGLQNHNTEFHVHYYEGLFKKAPSVTIANEVEPEKTVSDSNTGDEQTNKQLAVIKGKYAIRATKFKRLAGNNKGCIGADNAPINISFKTTTHALIDMSCVEFNELLGKYPALYLVELYKPNNVNRYGGSTETALLNNTFYPCSSAIKLESSNLNIVGNRGDTYYMMYDCLKTIPNEEDGKNEIIELGSFKCETRINLDGRYDKYKESLSNLTSIKATEFNKLNLGYTQCNDFFSYHIISDDLVDLNSFNNQITWTKTKSAGEVIDTWTNITLANIADADGTVGAITSLSIYNDNLLLFQEHGIAQIGYNEKTLISTDNNVPLELANSQKFTGFKYLSKDIGCQNKWSISISKTGILFIDNSRKELNIVAENIISLSTKFGFDSFFIKELQRTDAEFITFYDKHSKDIYYINKYWCLAYNEITNTFTSFYNYEGIDQLACISNHSLVFKDNIIWACRESSIYSSFFNKLQPYYITAISDGDKLYQLDKIYNNVEARADVFNNADSSTLTECPVFSHIAAWNAYQVYSEFSLDGTDDLYEWEATRRFGIWRYVIPRATYDDESGIVTDRIRSTFAFIKLAQNSPTGNRAIIHDLVVYFDVR